MSEEEYSAVASADTFTTFARSSRADEPSRYSRKNKRFFGNDDECSPLLRRFPSFQSTVSRRFRSSIRKMNCFKNNEEEEMPMMEVPRHKSIDIGVGLARRVSLFMFTRRTVCVHPYHPYTPEQTTRKIHVGFE